MQCGLTKTNVWIQKFIIHKIGNKTGRSLSQSINTCYSRRARTQFRKTLGSHPAPQIPEESAMVSISQFSSPVVLLPASCFLHRSCSCGHPPPSQLLAHTSISKIRQLQVVPKISTEGKGRVEKALLLFNRTGLETKQMLCAHFINHDGDMWPTTRDV